MMNFDNFPETEDFQRRQEEEVKKFIDEHSKQIDQIIKGEAGVVKKLSEEVEELQKQYDLADENFQKLSDLLNKKISSQKEKIDELRKEDGLDI